MFRFFALWTLALRVPLAVVQLVLQAVLAVYAGKEESSFPRAVHRVFGRGRIARVLRGLGNAACRGKHMGFLGWAPGFLRARRWRRQRPRRRGQALACTSLAAPAAAVVLPMLVLLYSVVNFLTLWRGLLDVLSGWWAITRYQQWARSIRVHARPLVCGAGWVPSHRFVEPLSGVAPAAGHETR